MHLKKKKIKILYFIATALFALYFILTVVEFSPWDINIGNYANWTGLACVAVLFIYQFVKEK